MRTFCKIIILILTIFIMATMFFNSSYARSSRFQFKGHRYSLKIAQIIINANTINTLINKVSLAYTPKITGKQSNSVSSIASSSTKIMLVKQMLMQNISGIQAQIASQLDKNFSRMELRRLSSFLSFGVGKKFAQLIVAMTGDIVINTAYELQGNPNVGANVSNIMGGGNNALMRGLAPAIMELLKQTQPKSRSKFNEPFKEITPIK